MGVTTEGVDYKVLKQNVNGTSVKVEIWDTGGQERFRTITRSYYDRAMGVILVYDCSEDKSFHDIRGWVRQIENYARPDIVRVLVASKCDIAEKKVKTESGQSLAKELDMKFFKTSSKTGENVKEAFSSLVEEIMAKKESVVEEMSDVKPIIVRTNELKKKKKDKCC
eukprot:TRINITY_DN17259_c0_g6_i1.p1 TRINITY_DN17259_c0_g6~~TRINITY_DN17259_c0_g6_i1.p1  ORF type:complete len:167 (+),score=56.45 TRINITY_DN17259_c0_g6_i1:107-607(+)